MKCPVCKDPDLLIAERQSVEIDYCPSCRGVWLDRGELDKLIQISDPPAPSRDVQRHERYDDYDRRDHHGHNRHGGYRKKRSLFDMFDFD